MAQASKSPWPADCCRLRLGPVEIDLRYRRIHGTDGVQELNPRCFDLLKLFLGEPRVLHTRDDIFRKVWPGVVVEDANLTTSVWMLRRALGNGAKQWIRTVSKQGYVFDPPIALQLETVPADEAPPPEVIDQPIPDTVPAPAAPPRRWTALLARRGPVLLAALVLAVIALAVLRYAGLERESGPRRVVLVTPIEADLPQQARWPTRLLYRWLDWQLRGAPSLSVGQAGESGDGGEILLLLSAEPLGTSDEWRVAARFRGPGASGDIVHQSRREQLLATLAQTSREALTRLLPGEAAVALAVDPALAPRLVEALEAEQARRWGDAAQAYASVVEKSPADGFARVHLAHCLAQLGQLGQARAELDRAQAWMDALPAYLREPLNAQALAMRRDYAAAAQAYAELQRRGGGETPRYRVNEANSLRLTGRSGDAAQRLSGETPAVAALAVPWLIEKAEAQIANRDLREAAETAAAALALAQQRNWPHEAAQAALVEADARGRNGDSVAPSLYQLAEKNFDSAGDRLAVLRTRVLAQLQQGQPGDDTALDQLLGEAHAAGNVAVEVDMLRRVGLARFRAGDIHQSRRRFEQAAAIAEGAGDVVERRRLDLYLVHHDILQLRLHEMGARVELLRREPQQGATSFAVGLYGARLHYLRGEFEPALASLDAASVTLGPASASGQSQSAPSLDCLRGAIHVVQGKPQLARSEYRSCRGAQNATFNRFADMGEAELALYTGDTEAGRRLLAPLPQLDAVESLPERWTLAMELVPLWARAGDLRDSDRVAEQVLANPAAVEFHMFEASLRISRAEIALARGDAAAALRQIERADTLLPADFWYERRRLRTVAALAAQALGQTETAAQQLDALHADTRAKGDVLGELLVHSLMASNPATTPCPPQRHQQLLLESGLRGASDRWMLPAKTAADPAPVH